MKSFKFKSRFLIVDDLYSCSNAISLLAREGFLALVPAYEIAESLYALMIVNSLMGIGCKEFCCVGTCAEKLHSEIDFLIEDKGELDIVTTSFLDEEEACEYFVFGADAGEASVLLALVARHPTLEQKLLEKVA